MVGLFQLEDYYKHPGKNRTITGKNMKREKYSLKDVSGS